MGEIPFKNYIIAIIVINLLTILVVLILLRFLPPQIPLFYGLPQSEEQLAPSWGLAIPSLVSTLIILFNIGVSFLTSEVFLKKILIVGGLLTSLFSIVTTIKIVLLVGSF